MSPPPFPPPVRKKGLSPLAWAGIGCGGLTILGIALAAILGAKVFTWAKSFTDHPAKAAAGEVLAAYPSVEKSNESKESGTLSLRLKSGGGSTDTSYDDIVHGRVEIPDASGTPQRVFQGDLTKVPSWVPRYPAPTTGGEISVLHQDLPDRIHGIIVADTPDGTEAIKKFFEEEADKLLSSRATTSGSADINGNRTYHASYSSGKRKLEIHAYGPKGSPMTIVTTYTEMK
ncbi:hypothetical protein [Haloferula sp. BvORR071]|uniref:hypothetical protein n=1 Tax=Haloferula sp. BvORR071 TaxID=1396141 RepID=UPI002240E9FC|nr:hypothetical protein [Haloferula sp. BvORR071]